MKKIELVMRMRVLLSMIVVAVVAFTAQAQVPALPAWMQSSFAAEATSTLPAMVRGPVPHNSFIGSYTARLSIRTPDGITQQLYLSAWQDSTRGIMQLELVRGIPHTTWFADSDANVAVVANAIGRSAQVSELKQVLLVDRLREPDALEEFQEIPMEPTGERAHIAGEECTRYDLVEAGNTLQLWTAEISPSPFADGPAWIPMNEGPLQAFRLLFKFGDRAVFKFVMEPLLELEIVAYHAGPVAPPVIDLSSYTVIAYP